MKLFSNDPWGSTVDFKFSVGKFPLGKVLWSVAKLDGAPPMTFFEILNFGDMDLGAPDELDARIALFEKP